MKKSQLQRKELLLEYVTDIGEADNYTAVFFKDDEGQRYAWRVYVTPNMSKVPAFFSTCTCIPGAKVKCRADILGTDTLGRVTLKNLRIVK